MSHTFWHVGDAESETIERGADARFHIICFCNYNLRNTITCHQRHRDLVDDGVGDRVPQTKWKPDRDAFILAHCRDVGGGREPVVEEFLAQLVLDVRFDLTPSREVAADAYRLLDVRVRAQCHICSRRPLLCDAAPCSSRPRDGREARKLNEFETKRHSPRCGRRQQHAHSVSDLRLWMRLMQCMQCIQWKTIFTSSFRFMDTGPSMGTRRGNGKRLCYRARRARVSDATPGDASDRATGRDPREGGLPWL